ncbi:MAG: hypothetical protein QOH05_4400 [Acetobacteraceae bacterium]|nr:hypothetical protein [Acetobacteraceae bacterium]
MIDSHTHLELCEPPDAELVATAAEAGCTTILTEDLADGGLLFGVRILNPFSGGLTLTPAAEALLTAA